MDTIDARRWDRINALFEQALAQDPEKRMGYLREACAGDDALYREVASLIEEDHQTHSLLDGVALDAVSLMDALTREGQRIGPYRLVRQLGEGGMGVVYLAERADGHFEQQVALKLIKRGMDSEHILRRFRAERQILARLHHPHIARLLDGGITDDGQPFFVMEYIAGEPIHAYCNRQDLSIDERLDLFTTVCKAVLYAHANLVVHRDLKPGNILVTQEGEVKLLDFGIAKVLEENEEGTALTVGGGGMTPQYASPEQVRGEAINTATDIYSLGVILYELLTGVRPYVFADRSPTEMARVVCENEPERPSTAVSRATQTVEEGTTPTEDVRLRPRRTEVGRLRRRLSGDLDVICLKALRKEPTRRYRSVEAFAEDIRRHIAGMPVLARPETAGYRMLKFTQRHRVGVGITAGVVLLITALVTFYTAQLRNERDRAELERQKAEEVVAFLQNLFEVSDPSESMGETVTARELLDAGAGRIEAELSEQPDVQAQMMQVIGGVYRSLGLYREARPLLERAVQQYRDVYGEVHEGTAASQLDYGVLLRDMGDLDAAEVLLREALATQQRLYGEVHPYVSESKSHLAYLLETKGDYADAEALYRDVLALDRTLFDADHPRVARSMKKLAALLRQMEDYEAAEPLLREALAMQRRQHGAEHVEIASTLRNLGSLLRDKGNYEEAEAAYEEALAMRRKLLGNEHPEVAVTLNSLAILLSRKGDVDGALRATREFVAIQEKIYDAPHPDLAAAYSNLAYLLRDQDLYDEAALHFQRSLTVLGEVVAADHPNRAFPLIGLASVYQDEGRYADAAPLLREALALRRAALPAGHRYIGDAASELGACLTAMKRYAEAEPLLLESYERFLQERGVEDGRTQRAQRRLARLYDAWGRPDEAARYRSTETPGS